MLLCLDVGNSQIYCGVYDGDELTVQFRRTSTVRSSSDELGVFLRSALRENGVAPEQVRQRHVDLSIESARPGERGVKHVGSVCSRDDDNLIRVDKDIYQMLKKLLWRQQGLQINFLIFPKDRF